jgi:hypothetical protein
MAFLFAVVGRRHATGGVGDRNGFSSQDGCTRGKDSPAFPAVRALLRNLICIQSLAFGSGAAAPVSGRRFALYPQQGHC